MSECFAKASLPKRRGRPPKIQVGAEAGAAGITPLDYMLAVIRDPNAGTTRRDRMAIAAAPYCHPRVADAAKGKKVQQAEAALAAGAGTVWGDDLEFEGRAN
jgi:phage terminase small subunit